MSDERLNNLAYWFPRLEAAGVPVPKTVIVETDLELLSLLDGQRPAGWTDFLDELDGAVEMVGGCPAFLRTGYGSHKHDWDRSCYVQHLRQIDRHVLALVDWSLSVDLPCWTWAVREFLPLRAAFTAFRGRMPVAREFRCFVADGVEVCRHPYWPPAAIEASVWKPSVPAWRQRLAAMNRLRTAEAVAVDALARRVAAAFEGAWSVDIAQQQDGSWVVIDMAEAARSYHAPECPLAEGISG